jgi:hypothetical protein
VCFWSENDGKSSGAKRSKRCLASGPTPHTDWRKPTFSSPRPSFPLLSTSLPHLETSPLLAVLSLDHGRVDPIQAWPRTCVHVRATKATGHGAARRRSARCRRLRARGACSSWWGQRRRRDGGGAAGRGVARPGGARGVGAAAAAAREGQAAGGARHARAVVEDGRRGGGVLVRREAERSVRFGKAAGRQPVGDPQRGAGGPAGARLGRSRGRRRRVRSGEWESRALFFLLPRAVEPNGIVLILRAGHFVRQTKQMDTIVFFGNQRWTTLMPIFWVFVSITNSSLQEISKTVCVLLLFGSAHGMLNCPCHELVWAQLIDLPGGTDFDFARWIAWTLRIRSTPAVVLLVLDNSSNCWFECKSWKSESIWHDEVAYGVDGMALILVVHNAHEINHMEICGSHYDSFRRWFYSSLFFVFV